MTEPMPPIEQLTPTERNQQATEYALSLAGTSSESSHVYLPRITIKYCTQCKWMLRAAYFAQELLSTFSTSLGEVSLIPTTGGVFTITIFHQSLESFSTLETRLWDRKTDGGFPEVKQLKSLVRNVVDPSRDLGHLDRALGKENKGPDSASVAAKITAAPDIDPTTPANPAATGDGSTGQNEGERKACEDCQ